MPASLRKQMVSIATNDIASAMSEAKRMYYKTTGTPSSRGVMERLNRIDPTTIPQGVGDSSIASPSNIERVETSYARCECETGLERVTFWPNDQQEKAVTVRVNEIRWVNFGFGVDSVKFVCNGMEFFKPMSVHVKPGQWLSLQVHSVAKKDLLGLGWCTKLSGELRFNVWQKTSFVSNVLFTSSTDGYACFRVPSLLATNRGSLIAFAEARRPDCGDFAETEVVFKRSTDGGKTWSNLEVLIKVHGDTSELGVCGNKLVIGNVAPVQLQRRGQHGNRILVPYTRNNFKTWIVHSDDDGVTWQGDREIPGSTVTESEPDCRRGMGFLGLDGTTDTVRLGNARSVAEFVADVCYQPHEDPYTVWKDKLTGPWQFVGVGPSGGLQLASGRVLIPGYHSYTRSFKRGSKNEDGDTVLRLSQLYNNVALGHTLISDDGGDTWDMSDDWEVGNGAGESQMVQLPDGEVLVNSRSLSLGSPQKRVQARSTDEGQRFSATEFVQEQAQPFAGCQGSMIGGDTSDVYVVTPDPPEADTTLAKLARALKCKAQFTGRRHITIFKSTDGGHTYPHKVRIDDALSGYSSLQLLNGKLVLLYEQADPWPPFSAVDVFTKKVAGDLFFDPIRLVFREIHEFGPISSAAAGLNSTAESRA